MELCNVVHSCSSQLNICFMSYSNEPPLSLPHPDTTSDTDPFSSISANLFTDNHAQALAQKLMSASRK